MGAANLMAKWSFRSLEMNVVVTSVDCTFGLGKCSNKGPLTVPQWAPFLFFLSPDVFNSLLWAFSVLRSYRGKMSSTLKLFQVPTVLYVLRWAPDSIYKILYFLQCGYRNSLWPTAQVAGQWPEVPWQVSAKVGKAFQTDFKEPHIFF